MKPSNNKKNGINSSLSLYPLLTVIQKITQQDKPGARKLYEPLLAEIEGNKKFLEPIDDVSILTEHSVLVETCGARRSLRYFLSI
jgi:hypothetical protein